MSEVSAERTLKNQSAARRGASGTICFPYEALAYMMKRRIRGKKREYTIFIGNSQPMKEAHS